MPLYDKTNSWCLLLIIWCTNFNMILQRGSILLREWDTICIGERVYSKYHICVHDYLNNGIISDVWTTEWALWNYRKMKVQRRWTNKIRNWTIHTVWQLCGVSEKRVTGIGGRRKSFSKFWTFASLVYLLQCPDNNFYRKWNHFLMCDWKA